MTKRYCKKCDTYHDIPSIREWVAMIHGHFPAIKSWRAAQDVLWNLTAFPFMGTQRAEGFAHYDNQLKELSEKSGGDLGKAWEISEKEMDEAMNAPEENEKDDVKTG